MQCNQYLFWRGDGRKKANELKEENNKIIRMYLMTNHTRKEPLVPACFILAPAVTVTLVTNGESHQFITHHSSLITHHTFNFS